MSETFRSYGADLFLSCRATNMPPLTGLPQQPLWPRSFAAQINQPWARDITFDEEAVEVEPARDGVEDVGVRGDGDAARVDYAAVGVEGDFDRPGPAALAGRAADALGEPAAVRDGAVQQPEDGRGAEALEDFARYQDGALRLLDGAV